ncbi:unnamed protein product [Vicia faba]|uniref:Uncharacterized protein n=1 Tax=Vicia faba TaxID=3906 RepID=A0AAV1AU24_VICFA|nr:unnamed protein product [Vicia faba]
MTSSSSTQPQLPQQPQVQQQQPLHIQVVQAQDSVVGQAVRWIFMILFCMQLFLISALVIFITSVWNWRRERKQNHTSRHIHLTDHSEPWMDYAGYEECNAGNNFMGPVYTFYRPYWHEH